MLGGRSVRDTHHVVQLLRRPIQTAHSTIHPCTSVHRCTDIQGHIAEYEHAEAKRACSPQARAGLAGKNQHRRHTRIIPVKSKRRSYI